MAIIRDTEGTLEQLADHLIDRHYPHLQHARIVYLWNDNTDWMNSGEARLVPDKFQKAGLQADFIITIKKYTWDAYAEHREPLLDHELRHCCRDMSGNWRMAKHEVTEFADIVGRHGLWEPALKQFDDARRRFEAQQLLPYISSIEVVLPEEPTH